MRSCTHKMGFSLIEAMLAVVILGIATAGVVLPYSSGAALQAEGRQRMIGTKLAGDLLEQIISKPMIDPNGGISACGPESGEASPAGFDNIDDWYGYSEAQGQLQDTSNSVITDPAYAKFSRDVKCEYWDVAGQDSTKNPTFIRVIVTVKCNDREVARIMRLVSENEVTCNDTTNP